MDREKEFENMKREYKNMQIPDELKERVEMSIARAKADTEDEKYTEAKKRSDGRSHHFKKRYIWGPVLAAACAVFVALPNASSGICFAMEQLPVIGGIVRVVTFRDYEFDDDNHHADVEAPALTNEDGSTTVGMDEINARINELTEQAITDFKSLVDEEGYATLDESYETVTDNDRYYTEKVTVFTAAADGFSKEYYFTIDKTTGEQVHLADLFKDGSDYVNVISDNILSQMREQMAASDEVMYFVDDDTAPNDEFLFTQIDADADFYFDDDGSLVIPFSEADVAPAYMGCISFTIPTDVIEGILK